MIRCLRKREGLETDDMCTSGRDGGGLVEELDDGLLHLKDLYVTWSLSY